MKIRNGLIMAAGAAAIIPQQAAAQQKKDSGRPNVIFILMEEISL